MLWQTAKPWHGVGVNELQHVECHVLILLCKSQLTWVVLVVLGEVLSCMHTNFCAQQLHFDGGPGGEGSGRSG